MSDPWRFDRGIDRGIDCGIDCGIDFVTATKVAVRSMATRRAASHMAILAPSF